MEKVIFSSDGGGRCQVQVHEFARFWATYVRAFFTSLSRGLANELLVTLGVLVTPDLCSTQDLVSSRHNRFSVMHTYVAL